jgi:hypothetical protein
MRGPRPLVMPRPLARGPSVARRAARKAACPHGAPWVLTFAILAIVGCRSEHPKPSPVVREGREDAAPLAYPRARWRLASPEALSQVVLWVSHILIRHERSDPQVPFALTSWNIEPPPPPRSYAEALRLANSVAARAAAAPETFASLARQYSEDIVTSTKGGSLGGIAATRLESAPEVLDAIAALRPGGVSRVVATSHGFHILLLRPPPALKTISGRRILVRYDGAPFAEGSSPPTGRSRDAALEIARHAADALRADPHRFGELLAQYSPSADPEDGGDIGVWTNQEPGVWLNHDPGPLEREREELANVEIGGVTDPIEGLGGFQVFVRTPVPADRTEYVVQILQLPTLAPEAMSERSAGDARKPWQAVAEKLSKTPDVFDVLRRRYCCSDSQRWSRGRTPANLLKAVASLPIGQISARPINEDGEPLFLFAKRLDSATSDRPPAAVFELPAPKAIDVDRAALRASGPEAYEFIGKLADEASASLGLDATAAARVKALHTELALALRGGETEGTRKDALGNFRTQMRLELTPAQYIQYQELVSQRVSVKVAGPL